LAGAPPSYEHSMSQSLQEQPHPITSELSHAQEIPYFYPSQEQYPDSTTALPNSNMTGLVVTNSHVSISTQSPNNVG